MNGVGNKLKPIKDFTGSSPVNWLARERDELEKLAERFNRYHWSPKISRKKLKELYESNAKGIGSHTLVQCQYGSQYLFSDYM